jgi:hypothetical protein
VKSKKDYYLSCIFTVVKTWHDAGKPKNPTDHDFREWAGTLDWIAQNIFELPPLLDGHRAQQTRVGSSALSFLHQVCKAVFDSGRCNDPLRAGDLASILQGKGVVPAGCEDTVDLKDWAQKIGSRMWQLFKDEDVISIDEFSIMRTEEEVRNEERRETKATKYYTFTRRRTEESREDQLKFLRMMANVVYEAGRDDQELVAIEIVELFEAQEVDIPGCDLSMGTGTMAKIIDSLLDPVFGKEIPRIAGISPSLCDT